MTNKHNSEINTHSNNITSDICAIKLSSCNMLSSGLSHTLNNLMSQLSSRISLIESEDNNKGNNSLIGDLRELYESITLSAKISQAISQLSGPSLEGIARCSVNQLLSEAKPVLEKCLREDIKFSLELDPHASFAEIEAKQLSQILIMLISFAKGFISQGGQITMSTKLMVENNNKRVVVIEICDSGKGLSHETKQELSNRESALALGPAMLYAFELASSAKAKLFIDSRPWQGSCYKLLLKEALLPKDAPKEEEAKPLDSSHHKKLVLVVEDDQGLRQALSAMLEKDGFSVVSAKDGVDALKILDMQEASIELLLSDVVMPNLSGIQLYNAMRVINPKTKVLFMSGYNRETMSDYGLSESDFEFIGKPFSQRELINTIHKIFA
jgi:two-component system cell cycle sensor histidine kinase/response regulator CckA